MISVIMPVYKAQQGITRTIESLLNQSYQDFEIICVDDCSPDGSLKILKELSERDSRIRVIHNTINRGAGYCRNLGFSHAKGEYCFFLDCDDFFMPDFLGDMYRKITETGADICFCNYSFVTSDGTLISTTSFGDGAENPFVPGENYDRLYQLSHAVPWNKIFRTDFIRQHHLMYAELSSSNDLSFTLLAFSLAEKIAYLDGSYIQYTKGDSKSTTMSLKDCHVDNVLKAYDILLSNIMRLPNRRDYFATFNTALNRSLNYRLKLRSNYNVSYQPNMSANEEFLEFRKNSGMVGDLVSAYVEGQPLITVVLTVSTGADFLHETLDSLITQSFEKIRIIVVNSQSSCTGDLDGYGQQDSRISIVNSVGMDLNRSVDRIIRQIESPFVMFCRSGEILDKEACSKYFYALVKSEKDICYSDFSLLAGDYDDYQGNQQKLAENSRYVSGRVNLQKLFSKASNKMYRTEIIRKNKLVYESESRFLSAYCRCIETFSEILEALVTETFFRRIEVVGQPQVSVIIPVYNVRKFIGDTLKSVCNQTLKNIEIICVDDCSTDGSEGIIKLYRKIDSRIRLISMEKNSSAQICRQNGVASSSGQYVMFLDGDDELSSNACETAFEAISKAKTDLLMFGTDVVNYRNQCAYRRIRRFESFVEPYTQKIASDNLLSAAFVEQLFSFNLWNKIYSGDLCRQVFAQMPEHRFYKANDIYAMAYILGSFKSYCGITDKLYRYKLGSGVTGTDLMTQEMFETMLTEHDVFMAIDEYLHTLNGDYSEVSENIRKRLMSESVVKFVNCTQNINNDVNMASLVNLWGYDDVVKCLAEKFWNEPKKVSGRICGYFKSKRPHKDIRTIAFYYRSISNGGAQRVTQLLCNRFAAVKNADGSYKYRVVLITDDVRDGDEYPLSDMVRREFLPNKDLSHEGAFSERYGRWRQIIESNGIDAVVSGHWMDECSFWDMLAVKATGETYYISHSHNFFAVPFVHKFAYKTSGSVLATYVNCDGVVNLSECDRRYTSLYCRNTAVIPNPLTFNPDNVPMNFLDNSTICWVGRISHEKNPVDLIKAMALVHQSLPEARLLIVGDGDESIMKKMVQTADELEISDCVEFAGFTEKVEKYYSQASVFVNTSKYEGFSMTFAEAMSHGLPVVTYDMPWLTFIEDGRGIVTVNQNDYIELGNRLVKILSDRKYMKKLGSEARANVVSMASASVESMWEDFLHNIVSEREGGLNQQQNEYRFMLDYLNDYAEERYSMTEDYYKRAVDKLSQSNSVLKTRNNGIYEALMSRVLKELRSETSHLESSSPLEDGSNTGRTDDTDKTEKEHVSLHKRLSDKVLSKGKTLAGFFGKNR